MDDNNDLEIYRQRYATFRHLDRVRWQLLQISVGVGSLALVLAARDGGELAWWALVGLGVMFIVFGVAMEKIRHGINNNNNILREYAIRIGDQGIPETSKPWQSVAWRIAWILIAVGVVCIIVAIIQCLL